MLCYLNVRTKSFLLSLLHPLSLRVLLQSNMLIDPIEYNLVPHHAVLWLEHPVVLIREGQELAFHPLALQHIEGRQSFTNGQSVIQLTVDYKLRCSPVRRKPMQYQLELS